MNKKIFFRATLVLVISYFMLVGVLYSQSVNSSSAKQNFRVTQVAPGCVQGLKSINASGRCRNNNLLNGFRNVRFECYGNSGGELHNRSCVSYDSLKMAATESCSRMSTCRVTPPITTATPTPAVELPPTEEITPTPTMCAMPTLPLCQNGVLIESDEPQSSGVCGPKYLCIANEELTPTVAE